MKLGWFLTILGGGYILFRVVQIWYYWPLLKFPLVDVGAMLGQALVFGGIPLFFGVRRLKKKYTD